MWVAPCDSTSQEEPSMKVRRVKKPVELKEKCWICRAPAAEHMHYGGWLTAGIK